MVNISVEANVEEINGKLKELGFYMPKAIYQSLKYVSNKGKNKLRSSYRKAGINTKSGALYRGIFGSVKNENTAYIGIIGRRLYKFLPINFGMTIEAKNNEYMTFKTTSGDWVKVKSITIKPHEFFSVADSYFNSEEVSTDMYNSVIKKVNKILEVD